MYDYIGMHFCSLNDFLWFGEAPSNFIGTFREIIHRRRQNGVERSLKWGWLQVSHQLFKPGGGPLPSTLGSWMWNCQRSFAGLLSSCQQGCIFLRIWIYPLYQNYTMMSGAGIAEGGWTSGQAWMFPTWGWKVSRGVTSCPWLYLCYIGVCMYFSALP